MYHLFLTVRGDGAIKWKDVKEVLTENIVEFGNLTETALRNSYQAETQQAPKNSPTLKATLPSTLGNHTEFHLLILVLHINGSRTA